MIVPSLLKTGGVPCRVGFAIGRKRIVERIADRRGGRGAVVLGGLHVWAAGACAQADGQKDEQGRVLRRMAGPPLFWNPRCAAGRANGVDLPVVVGFRMKLLVQPGAREPNSPSTSARRLRSCSFFCPQRASFAALRSAMVPAWVSTVSSLSRTNLLASARRRLY